MMRKKGLSFIYLIVFKGSFLRNFGGRGHNCFFTFLKGDLKKSLGNPEQHGPALTFNKLCSMFITVNFSP